MHEGSRCDGEERIQPRTVEQIVDVRVSQFGEDVAQVVKVVLQKQSP